MVFCQKTGAWHRIYVLEVISLHSGIQIAEWMDESWKRMLRRMAVERGCWVDGWELEDDADWIAGS